MRLVLASRSWKQTGGAATLTPGGERTEEGVRLILPVVLVVLLVAGIWWVLRGDKRRPDEMSLERHERAVAVLRDITREQQRTSATTDQPPTLSAPKPEPALSMPSPRESSQRGVRLAIVSATANTAIKRPDMVRRPHKGIAAYGFSCGL